MINVQATWLQLLDVQGRLPYDEEIPGTCGVRISVHIEGDELVLRQRSLVDAAKGHPGTELGRCKRNPNIVAELQAEGDRERRGE